MKKNSAQKISETIIPLDGCIKGTKTIQLGQKLEIVRNELFERVVIDLSQVSFMDSSALGALLYYQTVLSNQHIELVLRNPSQLLREAFENCNLNDFFTILAA